MWTVESMSSQRIKKVLFASELKDFFGAINRPNAWPALRLLGAFVARLLGSAHGAFALDPLQLKAFLILAQTISACSTSARKQDDLRQLADSSRHDQHVVQLATTSARVPISSRSRFISLVVNSTLLEVKVIRNLKENP
ncbi:hypothetical protein DY000_02016482 [Brassica cretica]|uniref:Uncharacterized protein n=1 Tax=Brassica cretica TaxID=69181 RepID=A0ABQ7CRG8_BRACR|nr:hypothetical protein DY000_02016482 [Brassica cretica]